jgi:hypothetical protein
MSLQLLKPERLSLKASLEGLTTEELRAELVNLLGLTAQNLLRLAMVVDVLRDRGEDLSAINRGFVKLLAAIACGKLLPEIVVMFAGNSRMLALVAKLPVKEQQAIVEGRQLPPPWPKTHTSARHTASRDDEFPCRSCGGKQVHVKGCTRKLVNKCDPERDEAMLSYREALRMIPHIGSSKDIGEMAAQLIMDSKDRQAALGEFVRIMKENRLWK